MRNECISLKVYQCILATSILAKLSGQQENEDVLSEAVPQDVYEELIKCLTIPDIQVLIVSLPFILLLRLFLAFIFKKILQITYLPSLEKFMGGYLLKSQQCYDLSAVFFKSELEDLLRIKIKVNHFFFFSMHILFGSSS